MKRCTLVIPIQWELVWLSRKKKKVGAGLYNGWGGKFDKEAGDKTMLDTAIREFGQETGGFYPNPEALKLVAVIDFYEGRKYVFKCYCYILKLEKGENEYLKETDEMGAGEWFDRRTPPVEKMMPGDRYWLPMVLDGMTITAHCYYKKGNKELESIRIKGSP